MQVTRAGDGLLRLSAAAYHLTFPTDRPFVYLHEHPGPDGRLLELMVASSIHPLHGRDETTTLQPWQVIESAGEVVFSQAAASNVWESKLFRLRCRDDRLTYQVEVYGHGRLAEANYFGGYSSVFPRWGSGWYWSGQNFKQGFTPEPNVAEQNYFHPSTGSTIDLMGVPLPAKGHWFFTPPPFCFSMQGEHGWLGLAVEGSPGSNGFTEYTYHGHPGAFFLSLSYEGHTRVDGAFHLPALTFHFGADEFAVLESHVTSLRDLDPVSGAPAPRPAAWWNTPIFCGWGAQCYLAAVANGHAPDFSRQEHYENFLAVLGAHDLAPGILVLDDKWQAAYGDNRADQSKWPDLPGFIARQHLAGRRVLLWLQAWGREGLDPDECIKNAAGIPLACDPTHPGFRQRLRESVHQMLSPEGYDADGFKIDFTARLPSGPGLLLHGQAWGLELMRLYLDLIRDAAIGAKHDALVMTHTPNPYLAGSLDMIRLNDTNAGTDVNRAMALRARLARIACPHALVDTDNWPMADRAAWRDYVRLQPQLGIPSLYFATHIDSTREPLTEEDYLLVRSVWAEFERKNRNAA